MSIQASRHVWATTKQSGSALVVLLAIADYADKAGLAWPTVKSLAAKARMSIRSVQYHITKLSQAGEIVVMEGDNFWSANRYQIAGLQRGGAEDCTGGMQAAAPGGCNPLHRGGAEDCTHKNPSDINDQDDPSSELPAAAGADAGAAGIAAPAPIQSAVDEKAKTPVMPVVEAAEPVIPESRTQPAAHTLPPSVPPVSPIPQDDCADEDLKAFFNGSTPHEIAAMIETYGRERIMAVINEVRLDGSARTPPALVIHKLRSGARAAWTWPERRRDGQSYITGKYAAFIEH